MNELSIMVMALMTASSSVAVTPVPSPRQNQIIRLSIENGRRVWEANIPDLGSAYFRAFQDGVLVSRDRNFSDDQNAFIGTGLLAARTARGEGRSNEGATP